MKRPTLSKLLPKAFLFSLVLAMVFGLVIAPSSARADAEADLAAGKAALQAADLPKALTLLQASAEALPQSVEAQAALGEAQLRLGNLAEAMRQYQLVVKLSPDHDYATRMVAALTANNTSFDNRLSAAKALMSMGQFDQASDLLLVLKSAPSDSDQKSIVRLLSAECDLWRRSPSRALSLALQIIEQDGDEARTATARVIAALAMAPVAHPMPAEIDKVLDATDELPEVWASRAAAARALSRVGSTAGPAEISTQLLALSSIPASSYRTNAISHAAALLETAQTLTKQGDNDQALKVLWPMLSSAAAPDGDVAGKEVDLTAGWLMSQSVDHKYRRLLVEQLAGISEMRFQRAPGETTFEGHWLAFEVIRQSPGKVDVAVDALPIVGRLASFSRVTRTRKEGESLSPADRLQRELLIRLAAEPMSAASQKKLAEFVLAQIARYIAVGDLKTGLTQFLTFAEGDAHLVSSLDNLRTTDARKFLLINLAAGCQKIGEAEFLRATSAVVVAKADVAVNPFDMAAISLLAELDSFVSGEDPSIQQTADEIILRYANAGHWDAAVAANAELHAANASDRRWSELRLRIRQATTAEDKLLAARRSLSEELAPLVKSSLQEAAALVKADPRDRHRQFAASVGDALIRRYFRLNRVDLAEAVVATLAADEASRLNDWSLWAGADLLDKQATKALVKVANEAEERSAIALHDLHKTEIAKLGEIIAKHPNSEFATNAVSRVEQIAGNYERYDSFDTARGVITAFLKAHPNLAAGEPLEYRAIQIALAKARHAFNERPDATKPPTELLASHLAAIDALTAFLKAHPSSKLAPQAENDLFAIARLYGNVDAWPVARTVLDRFTAAIPNYRSPGHLKLLQAATYLGQLDRNYGLTLLTPSPATHQIPATPSETALAMIDLPGHRPGRDDESGASRGKLAKPGDLAPSPADPAGGPPAARPQPRQEVAKPSESSLAMIRQSQERQYARIAMLESPDAGKGMRAPSRGNTLPSGVLISAAEMKRQDEAADKAYAVLIGLIKNNGAQEAAVSEQARDQVQWIFSFFENQLRADRAIVLIKRYLVDHPSDPQRVALAYRSLSNQIVWVRQRKPTEIIDQSWIDARHALFQKAREEIAEFIAAHADKKQWSGEAQLLLINSFEQEAELAKLISAERAAGLLVQCADVIQSLLKSTPSHPRASTFPQRIWGLAEQIGSLGQNEQAIYVLRQLTTKLPTHELANRSLIRIAQYYAANLSNPLRAVETYQDYLSRTDGDPAVPVQIFDIAKQLASQERYLEAIHVYSVFVDSFPTDPQAPAALHAIGRTHQANEAWTEAIATYDRIVEEYVAAPIIPQVKLDVAECRINLGEWSESRRLYEEFLEKFPKHSQVATATKRLGVLKKLDRFQDLLADDQIDRNKDDAQFQIGRTVLVELQNPVKAVEEFRKVVAGFPKSDVADDAQVEIGRALLSLNRLEEGRAELLKVAPNYPNSPLADDALFLVAQSYEQFAQQLASVTQQTAYEASFRYGQKEAYARFNKDVAEETERMSQRRVQLRAEGDEQQIALNDALDASRSGNLVAGKLFCHVTQAELEAETETALNIANRQDRINDAYREAIAMYVQAATDHPLGDKTDQSLIRIAVIFETRLKDRAAAMQTYKKIVEQFPGTPVAEDAAWKVAQFYVEEGRYTQAADSYKSFIRNYPASARVADAQFGLAEVLEQLGQWVDAMDAYEVFRQKFDKHPKVRVAMDQIGWIKTYRK